MRVSDLLERLRHEPEDMRIWIRSFNGFAMMVEPAYAMEVEGGLGLVEREGVIELEDVFVIEAGRSK